MRTDKTRFGVLVVAIFHLAVSRLPARAGLLSNVDLDQVVFENDLGNGTGHGSSTNVIGTTIPFQQSATVTDQSGGDNAKITATYSITDNGSVATFGINCSGYLSTNGYSATESTENAAAAMFYLTQPCLYTETYSCTGKGYSVLTYQDTRQLQINGSISNSTKTYSGTINAGFFGINEGWALSNTALPNRINQTGTDSISITFYATQPIPEPSSAMLIGLPALALLARRPRPARRRIA